MDVHGLGTEHFQRLARHLARWGQDRLLRWYWELPAQRQDQLAWELEGVDLARVQAVAFGPTGSAGGAGGRTTSLQPAEVLGRPLASSGVFDEVPAAAAIGGAELQAERLAVVLDATGPADSSELAPSTAAWQVEYLRRHAVGILELNERYGVELPLYVMTGPGQAEDLRQSFFEHNYFGLRPRQVEFFPERRLPAVERLTGNLLLGAKHSLASSPRGDGPIVPSLAESGHLKELEHQGVTSLYCCRMENPALSAADLALVGQHVLSQAEFSIRVVRCLAAERRCGALVQSNERLRLVEPSSLSRAHDRAHPMAERTRYWTGTSMCVFSVEWLCELAPGGTDGPCRRAARAVPWLNEHAERICPSKPNAVVLEQYLADWLPWAERAIAVAATTGAAERPWLAAEGGPAESDVPGQGWTPLQVPDGQLVQTLSPQLANVAPLPRWAWEVPVFAGEGAARGVGLGAAGSI